MPRLTPHGHAIAALVLTIAYLQGTLHRFVAAIVALFDLDPNERGTLTLASLLSLAIVIATVGYARWVVRQDGPGAALAQAAVVIGVIGFALAAINVLTVAFHGNDMQPFSGGLLLF